MRKLTLMTIVVVASLALAGCGGGGVQAPAEVAGTWGADCGSPFVQFDGGKVHVFPDKATYDLKSAQLAGGQLTIGYTSAQGEVSEVYVLDGQTLRLDHGTYAGTEATWHTAPMQKCG